jgi:hypothetical protein
MRETIDINDNEFDHLRGKFNITKNAKGIDLNSDFIL